MKARIQNLQLEIDILKETLDVLKKDPGVDMTTLKNREKAVIVGVLKNKYSLLLLLWKLSLSKSSYYYQQKPPDKYTELRTRILELFIETSKRYGYRRIHALLAKESTCISETIVRKIMFECTFKIRVKASNKYSSYKGEITPVVPNVI